MKLLISITRTLIVSFEFTVILLILNLVVHYPTLFNYVHDITSDFNKIILLGLPTYFVVQSFIVFSKIQFPWDKDSEDFVRWNKYRELKVCALSAILFYTIGGWLVCVVSLTLDILDKTIYRDVFFISGILVSGLCTGTTAIASQNIKSILLGERS